MLSLITSAGAPPLADRGVGQTLPSDYGPAPDASRGWWLAAPRAEHRRQLAAEGSQDYPVSGSPPSPLRGSSEDEQLLAEDEEFEVAIGGCAAAEYEEVDQQAKESIEEGQQHERAE